MPQAAPQDRYSDGAQHLCSATQLCHLPVCGHPRHLPQHLWRALILSHFKLHSTNTLMITVYHAFQHSKGQCKISTELINLLIKWEERNILAASRNGHTEVHSPRNSLALTSSRMSRTDPNDGAPSSDFGQGCRDLSSGRPRCFPWFIFLPSLAQLSLCHQDTVN